jgi:branched-chain amino acid transport system permease protein
VDVVLQHAWNGLAVGAIYALIALGYTMVYGVLKFINFAHSEVFMVGAFAAWYASRGVAALQGQGALVLLGCVVVAMAACVVLVLIIERLAYRPLRNAPRINSLITAIGISLLLQNLGQNVFGAAPKSFPDLIERTVFHPFGDMTITRNSVVVLAVAFVLMLLLNWIVYGTKVGTAMRAVSENPPIAALIGVPVNFIITFTFAIGAALAGAGGVLYALSYPQIDPIMGLMPGLKAFVAAVLGGIGSVKGAVVGGLVIGLAEAAIVGMGYSTWRDAIAFAILILILLVYPTGLFGRADKEKV